MSADASKRGAMAGFSLPWPPSLNRYWRNVHGRTLISAEGRSYRWHAVAALSGVPRFGDARVSVTIGAMPPDRRRRDLDNMLKAALDALTHAGVLNDDSQIDRLVIERGEPVRGGLLTVAVRELPRSTLFAQNAAPSETKLAQEAA